MLAAVQALLHAPDELGGEASLIKQVSIATALLTQSPGLYGVCLSVLASAYQCYTPDKVRVCMVVMFLHVYTCTVACMYVCLPSHRLPHLPCNVD